MSEQFTSNEAIPVNRDMYAEHSRLNYVDTAKGILIYLVFVGHILNYASISSVYIFAMHMPAFFLINGFLGAKSFNLSFGAFFFNRCKTYIVPYFIFALIGAVIHMCWGDFRFLNTEMFRSLLVTCMPDWLYIGAGWFLIAAFWGNIFFYYFKKYIEDNKKVSLVEKIAIILMNMYISIHILEINPWVVPGYNRIPWRIDSGLMAFTFMVIGYYMKKEETIEKFKSPVSIFISIVLFFSVARINGWVNIANCSYNNGIYFYIASCLGTYSILTGALWMEKLGLVSKILGEIGKVSLPMFMLHGMFLSFMNTHMNIVTGTIPLGRSLWYGLVLVIVVFPFAKLYMFCYNRLEKFLKYSIARS